MAAAHSALLLRQGTATRRQWLRLSLGSGAALAAGLQGSAAGAKVAAIGTPLKLQWRDRAMVGLGTTLSLRAGHADATQAEAGLDAAVKLIRHVERQMSLFDPQSAISQLNRNGVLHDPHPDFVKILKLAQWVSQHSQGAFDITVQPLWLAWQRAQAQGRLPSAAEVKSAQAQVGWQQVEVSRQRIRFARPHMAITLNGIAQGFAGDLAKAALQSHGVAHALIDTGEWSAWGQSPQSTPWALGVADPRHADALIARLTTDGRAVATSSDAHYRFGSDDQHHHIFNPKTGYSPRALASVTVLAPTCALADALTKVMFMTDAAQALELAKQWQVDVLAVEKTGRWRASAGLMALMA